MTFPDDENGDVLRRMEAHGFDFSVPHSIDFFAIFPTEEAADFVAALYVADDKTDPLSNIETRPAESGGMELIVAKKMLATHDNITRFEQVLRSRTENQGGHLDGWGALSDPSIKTMQPDRLSTDR
jgi:regulator of ribonuclease activity B